MQVELAHTIEQRSRRTSELRFRAGIVVLLVSAGALVLMALVDAGIG
jgi:hypothetical protein